MAFINLEKCEEKREGQKTEEVEVDSERDGKTWNYKLVTKVHIMIYYDD